MISFKTFITESSDLDDQLRKLGLKRTNKFGGIGKEIGGEVYLHRDYENTLPQSQLEKAKESLTPDYPYVAVKYNPKTGVFSFIISNDFDTVPEPSVNGGMTVKPDGTAKRFPDAGWIWHHKWMWVADDYKGFDVEESKRRSLEWTSIQGIDKNRIGQRKFWDTNVVPLLSESLLCEDKFSDLLDKNILEFPNYHRNNPDDFVNTIKLFKELVAKKKITGKEADIQYWIKQPSTLDFKIFVEKVNFEYESTTRGMKARASKKDYPIVFENEHYVVFQVKTYGAMIKLATVMDWCITSDDQCDTFNSYTKDGSIFYLIDSNPPSNINQDKYTVLVKPNGYQRYFNSDNNFDGMYTYEINELLASTKIPQEVFKSKTGKVVLGQEGYLVPEDELEEGINMKSFKDHLHEAAPPPEDWDLKVFDKSFKKQLDYATEKASKLGTGSSRVVFEIPFEGRTTVLKIAKNAKGLAQNNKEADYGLYRMYPSITCPMIDYDEEHDDPKWIHVEKAEKLTKSKFKAIEGFSFEDFYYLLKNDEDVRNGRKGRNFQINWEARVDAEEREKIWESELFGDVTDLMANFDILAGDLGRTANWGIYKGNPVIIDLGFDSHVNAQHYERKR